GNKASRYEIDRFLRKTAAALEHGINLLIVDLQPPGSFDPHGIHAAIWEYVFGTAPEGIVDQSLTLAAYRADSPITAYVEQLSPAATLPDMPLFLAPSAYINVPLEATYLQTWAGFPQPWKDELNE
ncbi:MAG: hypothetical protein WD070_06990, partial [Pirellulaceae bacterium]